MSGHTPGPWVMTQEQHRIAPSKTTFPVYRVISPKDVDAVFVRFSRIEDALLVAAAPDLLAALKDLVEAQERRERGEPFDLPWGTARAAIAKAEEK